MADLSLPIMARTGTAEPKALLCWARQDLAPPFDLDWRSSPYDQMCAGPPVSDFGLCAHHLPPSSRRRSAMRRAPDPGQGSLFAPAAELGRSAMDPQIPMANHTFARRDARPTSAAAAVGALPRPGTQRARVYEAIRQAPAGLTDREIATTLGLAENSVRPRRLELSDPPGDLPRLIADSGQRRQTSTGKLATVWVALKHAEEVARGA